MADQDRSEPGGGVYGPMNDLLAQMRGLTGQLAGMSGFPALPGGPVLPSLPTPAALSAGQLKAVASTIAAQRSSIEAMQAQLRAFDEQLAVLEQILEPLTELTNAWANLEHKTMGRPAGPAATDGPT